VYGEVYCSRLCFHSLESFEVADPVFCGKKRVSISVLRGGGEVDRISLSEGPYISGFGGAVESEEAIDPPPWSWRLS
jgi:hypothetical protein